MTRKHLKNIISIKKKPLLTNTELYVVFSLFGFIVGLLLFIFYTPNYFDSDRAIEFEIKQGASFTTVVDSLYSKGVIPSQNLMHIAAFLYSAETNVKAGKYNIPNGLSYFKLIELLLTGSKSNQIKVTIPEGIWQHNLAGLLAKELNLDSVKILYLSSDKGLLRTLGINANSIEGYLLPETFYFYDNIDEYDALKKLYVEMNRVFEIDSVKMKLKELNMTKHEILTMASIIDGESNIRSEFRKISGVYHNRLKKSMLLQADPTVQYLKRHSKRRNRIYYKDLEIDSPYNTYKYAGLPPGPINNPGKDAVLAALFPEEHNYYYFVADGTGGHVFAKTLKQHNRNVSEYRRWRRNNR
jgi:UPF0755 protein